MRANVTFDGGLAALDLDLDEKEANATSTPWGWRLRLDDGDLPPTPGSPGMPYRRIHVALPGPNLAAKVRASVIASRKIAPAPVILAPVQPLQPLGERRVPPSQVRRAWSSPKPKSAHFSRPPSVAPTPALYEAFIRRPPPLARVAGELAAPSDELTLEIRPFFFDRHGALWLATKLHVEIELQPHRQAPPPPPLSSMSRHAQLRTQLLRRRRVINPEDLQLPPEIRRPLRNPTPYLIITDTVSRDPLSGSPQARVSGDIVAEFERLARWKRIRGLGARVVTVTGILSGEYDNPVGGHLDLPHAIRRFLRWSVEEWGTTWVLLGGLPNLVPVRRACGSAPRIGKVTECSDEELLNAAPPLGRSYWRDEGWLMVNAGDDHTVEQPGLVADKILTDDTTGQIIPYGSQAPLPRRWYYVEGDWVTPSSVETPRVRVDGPEQTARVPLRWYYDQHTLIPTDLYYASLSGDWDTTENGLYAQWADDRPIEPIRWRTDLSVGRAPVSSAADAKTFVDKLLDYEKNPQPDHASGGAPPWWSSMLIATQNHDGRSWFSPTGAFPPAEEKFFHSAGEPHTLLHVALGSWSEDHRLLSKPQAGVFVEIDYDSDAGVSRPGWYYACSDADLSPSLHYFVMPVRREDGTWTRRTYTTPNPTPWVVVYASADLLHPQRFVFDRTMLDTNHVAHEALRQRVEAALPELTNIQRLYEDTQDLPPEQIAAGPIAQITEAAITQQVNSGVTLASFAAHGWYVGAGLLTNEVADNLSNGGTLPVVYAQSCMAGGFDRDSLGKHLLLNPNGGGAVAFIGSSRFSWPDSGFMRTPFFEALTETRRLGELFDARLSDLNTDDSRLCWCALTLNLQGDPELPIWLGPPGVLRVHHLPFVDPGERIVIAVFSQGGPSIDTEPPWVYIDDQIAGHPDPDGRFSFTAPRFGAEGLEVIVTRVGFRPSFTRLHRIPTTKKLQVKLSGRRLAPQGDEFVLTFQTAQGKPAECMLLSSHLSREMRDTLRRARLGEELTLAFERRGRGLAVAGVRVRRGP